MNYHISYQNPLQHLVDIELTINDIPAGPIILQLPAWRPGRYELQNYAANLKQFCAFDQDGKVLPSVKITRNQWKVTNPDDSVTTLKVRYQYYAYQMDAGGCWLDEEQLYLNFICCLLYEPSRIGKACTVSLTLPATYQIACGLPKDQHILKAENFYHLADSPMMASTSLTHFMFTCMDIPFHIWIQGTYLLPEEKIMEDFRKYTESQIRMMGDFPEQEYHYLFQFLPYRHYHGVEHRNSTVITLGPAESIQERGYSDLLGISSHELFHAWNIVKIRPAEMLPYDFTKENYFSTGFVAEGFTTYYGDLFLVRSGVISVTDYFAELTTTLKRHFDNFGNYHLSLAESSQDLWVDGYVAGIPDRKVSIYVKGCLVALLLDLELRSKTNHEKSLDDLMRILWNDFGKKEIGYTMEDILRQSEHIARTSLQDFFDECIFGRTDLKERLSIMLSSVGCLLAEQPSEELSEKLFGFRTLINNGRTLITAIAPGSPAEKSLSKDDEILEINGQPPAGPLNEFLGKHPSLTLTIKRWGEILQVKIVPASTGFYYNQYTLTISPEITAEQQQRLDQWLYTKKRQG